MEPEPAEVPPHGPPSPMAALLAAFVGLLALLYAGRALGGGGATVAAVAGALGVGALAAGALLYARFRRREAAFDLHVREHGGP